MEERQYRYEMHLHTAEGSRCADRTVEEQLTLYRDLGYAGVCLTDHDILSLPRQHHPSRMALFCGSPAVHQANAGLTDGSLPKSRKMRRQAQTTRHRCSPL